MRATNAEVGESVAVTLHRQGIVWRGAGETHGTADRDSRGGEIDAFSRVARQCPQEGREDVLEPIALLKYCRGLEVPAGRKGLEGLEEAQGAVMLEQPFDRPRAALSVRGKASARWRLREAQVRGIYALR